MWTNVFSYPALEPILLPSKTGTPIAHNALVNKHIPTARDRHWYWTKPGLYNGHLQTLAASGGHEEADRIYYGRRLFKWNDGSLISVDYALDPPNSESEWAEDVKYAPIEGLPRYPVRTRYLRPEEIPKLDDPSTTKPLVISIHGLTGGSHESYVRSVINHLIKPEFGFDCAVITSRGCNRSLISNPQLFNGAWTDDLRELVNHVSTTQPQRPIYLVGYSLGASILSNYLGQEAENSKIAGAVVVANPWDLNLSNYLVESSWIGRNVYGPAMASNLMRVLRNNLKVLVKDPIFNRYWEEAKTNGIKPKTTGEFDNNFTAPIFGFESATDYYRSASSINRLSSVRTPTLVLHAKDDPIVTDPKYMEAEIKRNPYVHSVHTDVGGHLGWFALDGTRWFSLVVAQYFKALYEEVDREQPIQAHISDRRRWFVNGRFDHSARYASN